MTGLEYPFNIRRFWIASDGRKASEQATTPNTLHGGFKRGRICLAV